MTTRMTTICSSKAAPSAPAHSEAVTGDKTEGDNKNESEKDFVPKFEEQLILDSELISISAKNVNGKRRADEVILLSLQNKTDKEMVFFPTYLINEAGMVFPLYLSQNVIGPKEELASVLHFAGDYFSGDLAYGAFSYYQSLGLGDALGDFRLVMTAHEKNGEDIKELARIETLTVKTEQSGTEANLENIHAKEKVLDREEITIYFADSFSIPGETADDNTYIVLLYCENKSGTDFRLVTENYKYNDKFADNNTVNSHEILADTNSFYKLYFRTGEFDKSGVETIEKIECDAGGFMPEKKEVLFYENRVVINVPQPWRDIRETS